MFDGEAFGLEIVSAVRGYIDAELAVRDARIAELEAELKAPPTAISPDVVTRMVAEAVAALPAPRDGVDADPAEIERMVAERVAAAVAAIPPGRDGVDGKDGADGQDGKDGASVILEDLEPLIAERLAEALAQLPVPINGQDGAPGRDGVDGKDGADGQDGKDGASVILEDLEPLIAERLAEALAQLPVPINGQDGAPGRDGVDGKDGADGRDADPEHVMALVTEALAALPPPQDGKSVTAEDVAPLIAAEVEKAVAALPAPKDGVGLAGALIDRAGSLILTLTDGQTRDLGVVMGRDGRDGADGQDGERGPAGFSLDQFDAELKDDGRTLVLRFTQGEQVETRELPIAAQIYRGVYRDAQTYQPGDTVTWAGSLWHCDAATNDKPGDGQTAWTLAVKKGRDGKDGAKGVDGKQGPPGKDGRGWG